MPRPASAAAIAASALFTVNRGSTRTSLLVGPKRHSSVASRLSNVIMSWADWSFGAFGVLRGSRYPGLATRTRLTDPRRIAIMLLSARSPTRTATSKDSSAGWMLRSRQMDGLARMLGQNPGNDRQHMQSTKTGWAPRPSVTPGLGVLAQDAALGPFNVLQHCRQSLTTAPTGRTKDCPRPIDQYARSSNCACNVRAIHRRLPGTLRQHLTSSTVGR
jgi:hypothetical protein